MKTNIIDAIKKIDISNKELSLKENLEAFNTISDNRNSVLRLYDLNKENYALILSWKGVNKWKIDHPIELHKIHKQRYATKEQSAYLLKKIYNRKDILPEYGFIDVPVKHFTLDDMLEFKREDDMMLRGQDPNQSQNSAPQKKESIKKESVETKPTPQLAKKTTQKPPVKKTTPVLPKKKNPLSKGKPVEKTKPQTSITMGENLNTKKPTQAPKKVTPKSTKAKPKDDNSFFQI